MQIPRMGGILEYILFSNVKPKSPLVRCLVFLQHLANGYHHLCHSVETHARTQVVSCLPVY